jgi:hypothetical protein
VTATTAVQADHRGLLLQAYAAYNSQDVEALVALAPARCRTLEETQRKARTLGLEPQL